MSTARRQRVSITPALPDLTLAVRTGRGVFGLRTVSLERHLALVHRWMHAEHVVPYWRQAWPVEQVATYLREQFDGGVSRPCVGSLSGVPVSYWEIYRPVADPVGKTYPADPHDLGVHLLIGDRGLTGLGLGSVLLDAVTAELLRLHPSCARVVAEPDVRNIASIRAFAKAGFERAGDVILPDKTAALMVRTR